MSICKFSFLVKAGSESSSVVNTFSVEGVREGEGGITDSATLLIELPVFYSAVPTVLYADLYAILYAD